jgi:hypothetical protein
MLDIFGPAEGPQCGNKAAQRILGSQQAGKAHCAAASGEDVDRKGLRVQLSR